MGKGCGRERGMPTFQKLASLFSQWPVNPSFLRARNGVVLAGHITVSSLRAASRCRPCEPHEKNYKINTDTAARQSAYYISELEYIQCYMSILKTG